MFIERLITSLVSAALKNPRAAATAVLILVVGFLGYTVKFLFIRSDEKDVAAYENLVAENRELKGNVATLRYERDSLYFLVGEVRSDGYKREIALKDNAMADLKAFNEKLQAQKEDMARKLNGVQGSAYRTQIASENLKKRSDETN